MNPRFLAYRRAPRSQVLKGFSDEELADLIAQGHEEAFETLVTRHRRVLLNHCSQVVGRSDAEEAVQETMLRAYLSLSRGHSVQRVGAWLRTIAHNTALNLLRARGARPAPADQEASDVASDPFEQREQLQLVLEALGSLPERQREALIMREWEGRSYAEIESRLQTSNGAVRQLLNRARSRLRTRLGTLAGFEPALRWIIGNGSAGSNTVRLGALGGGCAVTIKLCAAALLPAGLAPGPSTGAQAPRPAQHPPALTAAPHAGRAMNQLSASGGARAAGVSDGSQVGASPHAAAVYAAYRLADPWAVRTRIGVARRTTLGGPPTTPSPGSWTEGRPGGGWAGGTSPGEEGYGGTGAGGSAGAYPQGSGAYPPDSGAYPQGSSGAYPQDPGGGSGGSGQAPSGSHGSANSGGPSAYSAGADPPSGATASQPTVASPQNSASPSPSGSTTDGVSAMRSGSAMPSGSAVRSGSAVPGGSAVGSSRPDEGALSSPGTRAH